MCAKCKLDLSNQIKFCLRINCFGPQGLYPYRTIELWVCNKCANKILKYGKGELI